MVLNNVKRFLASTVQRVVLGIISKKETGVPVEVTWTVLLFVVESSVHVKMEMTDSLSDQTQRNCNGEDELALAVRGSHASCKVEACSTLICRTDIVTFICLLFRSLLY